ncbi:metal-dependent hydrolase [Paenibacillus sp. P25]|nr:metal-dependent hydrolase [Paenibacillus sp. P25]
MDTGSHLLFGATLAGLSSLSPAVAHEPRLFHAVLTAALVGSHAPDLDAAARLKSYAAYIRIHRGWTHSLPALFIWPLVLAWPIAWTFGVPEHGYAALRHHVCGRRVSCAAGQLQCIRCPVPETFFETMASSRCARLVRASPVRHPRGRPYRLARSGSESGMDVRRHLCSHLPLHRHKDGPSCQSCGEGRK